MGAIGAAGAPLPETPIPIPAPDVPVAPEAPSVPDVPTPNDTGSVGSSPSFLDQAASWTNDNIGVPIHDGVLGAASWTNDYIGVPIHDGVLSAASWTDSYIADPIRGFAGGVSDAFSGAGSWFSGLFGGNKEPAYDPSIGPF